MIEVLRGINHFKSCARKQVDFYTINNLFVIRINSNLTYNKTRNLPINLITLKYQIKRILNMNPTYIDFNIA